MSDDLSVDNGNVDLKTKHIYQYHFLRNLALWHTVELGRGGSGTLGRQSLKEDS